MLSLATFTELFALGLHPIPVIWDINTRTVLKHPEHIVDTTDGIPSIDDVKRWMDNGLKNYNGIALKMLPPFGMLDFDLKNTNDKEVYKKWVDIVLNTNPDILSKCCIETTRSGGYHVYIKYEKLDHKIPVARSANGDEVISVYTGGLLSYCSPSPYYQIIHGDFESIDYLTDEEFDFLVQTAALFNEDKTHEIGGSRVAVIDYPTEYESLCIQFDEKCTPEVFDTLLNSIDLYEVKDQRQFHKQKWVAYLRKGSNAAYSAKVYFNSKRLLIFSASMRKFPTWHDSAKSGDNTWSLSPSKIVFYKNDKDWTATIEEINMICESAGIDIIEQLPVSKQPVVSEDRLKFPYDIFPEWIQNYISFQSIQHEYLAGSLLASLSTAIGNTVFLEAMDGYVVKPILYMAIIAPPGASKTPALKKAFATLEEYDAGLFEKYAASAQAYKEKLAAYKRDKKGEEPEPPPFPQTLIKDSTIEMVIKILSDNKVGCCVLADELSGFLNRMNQYKAGDEVQKWLELWSGASVLLQRITREANKVEEPFCNVIGGIQPGVLEKLSKAENEHNGFFHRFLFVYPKPKEKNDWAKISVPMVVQNAFFYNFSLYFQYRDQSHKHKYLLSDAANELYGSWFNYKNIKYNNSTNDHVKGIIAKYQEYCLRFAVLLQVTHDLDRRTGVVDRRNMERAIRLTEFFLGNMHKATKILIPESPADKLAAPYDDYYKLLPEAFGLKTAYDLAKGLNIKENTAKSFINRNINKLFSKIENGKYEKMY